jgi:hypothetical protein
MLYRCIAVKMSKIRRTSCGQVAIFMRVVGGDGRRESLWREVVSSVRFVVLCLTQNRP